MVAEVVQSSSLRSGVGEPSTDGMLSDGRRRPSPPLIRQTQSARRFSGAFSYTESGMPRRPPIARRVHAALIAAAATAAAAAALAASAHAQGVIGGQLSATGGTVDIVVQPGTATFTSQLFLLHPDGTRQNIALNTEVGKRVTLGPFPAGQELMFGITVFTGGPTYLIGPARRNPDGIVHAQVTEIDARSFLVGFEDVFDGGDRDYDDNSFQFTGNLAPRPPDPPGDHTPTPTAPTANSEPSVAPLKLGKARSRLPSLLRKHYGRRYTSRRGPLKKSCRRLSIQKVGCGVGWNTKRHRYSGNVTMWNDHQDPDAIRFTTSIRRTRRAT